MNTTIITNGSSPYTITSSQYSATVPTSLSHKERPYDFLPVPKGKYRAGQVSCKFHATAFRLVIQILFAICPLPNNFLQRNLCQFALLFHRTGLIDGFLHLNGTSCLWTFPSVSVCCPDIQAYRIKQCSASLYYTADLTATFCGNIIMRIRLSLTVSVFRRNITESPKHTYRSIPLHIYLTYAHPKHAD